MVRNFRGAFGATTSTCGRLHHMKRNIILFASTCLSVLAGLRSTCVAQSQMIYDSIRVWNATPGAGGTIVTSVANEIRNVTPDGTQLWGRRVIPEPGGFGGFNGSNPSLRSDGLLLMAAAGVVVPPGAEALADISVLTMGADGTLLGQFGASAPTTDIFSPTLMMYRGSVAQDDQGGCFVVITTMFPDINEVVKFQDGVAQWWKRLASFDVGQSMFQQILADGLGGCYLVQLVEIGFDTDFRVTHFAADGGVLGCRKYIIGGSHACWDADLLGNGHILITGAFASQVLGGRCMHVELSGTGEVLGVHLTGPFSIGVNFIWTTQVLSDGSFLSCDGDGQVCRVSADWIPLEAHSSSFTPPPLFSEQITWAALGQEGDHAVMSGIRRTVDLTWGIETLHSMVLSLTDGDLTQLCQLVPMSVSTVVMPMENMTVIEEPTTDIQDLTYGPLMSTFHLEEAEPQNSAPYCGPTGLIPVREAHEGEGILVTPGHLQVKAPSNCLVRLVALHGSRVREWRIGAGTTVMDLEGVLPGMYCVELTSLDGRRREVQKVTLVEQ